LLDVLRKEAPSKILDLGCGNGALCACLHFHGFDFVGMEPDEGGVAIVRERLPSASFYQLGVDDSPITITKMEGLFDVVVTSEVIEHFYAPHLLYRFASGCLSLGGALIVKTLYHGYLKNLLLSLAGK